MRFTNKITTSQFPNSGNDYGSSKYMKTRRHYCLRHRRHRRITRRRRYRGGEPNAWQMQLIHDLGLKPADKNALNSKRRYMFLDNMGNLNMGGYHCVLSTDGYVKKPPAEDLTLSWGHPMMPPLLSQVQHIYEVPEHIGNDMYNILREQKQREFQEIRELTRKQKLPEDMEREITKWIHPNPDMLVDPSPSPSSNDGSSRNES